MTTSTLLRRFTACLAGLGAAATIVALVLHVRPIEYSTSGDGGATIGSVWTSWETVAIFAGITIVFSVVTILLRNSSP